MRHGRDPGQIDVILRVNAAAAATPADIAAVITTARQVLGLEHAYVDLMDLAQDADQALGIVSQVIDRVRNR